MYKMMRDLVRRRLSRYNEVLGGALAKDEEMERLRTENRELEETVKKQEEQLARRK